MDNYKPQTDDDEFMRQQMEAYRAFERQKATSPVPSPVKVAPIESKVVGDPDDANLLAQQEALAFYQRKQSHQHEEQADYLLALKFQQEEEEAQRQAEIERKRKAEVSDAQLAIKLLQQEQDQIKQRQEQAARDAEIAKRILEEDEKREKQERDKKDLEATMNLIRDEAKYELQLELDRIKAEKSRLENQLANQVHLGNPLELSLADCEYPDDWEWQDQPHALFEVRKGSTEWNRINGQFKMGMPNGNITRIQRNQNRTLWMWYWLKRNEIAKKNNRGPNERLVWHGSRNNAYDTIIKEGFDIRVANMSGAIGVGVYFASSSSTSSGYVVGGGGTKKMIYSRVVLGEMGQGQQGLRRPPEKRHGVLYDSVGNNTMYVVFDNHQAFPEYVIYYNQR